MRFPNAGLGDSARTVTDEGRNRFFSGIVVSGSQTSPGNSEPSGVSVAPRPLPQTTPPRSYGREDFVFDPRHYLALLERKIGALDQAAPLQGWTLPGEFGTLRRLL